MSSHSTKARLTQVLLATVAVIAVIGAAAVGWAGLPQERAEASVPAGGAPGASARFAAVVAAAVPASAQHRLLAPTISRAVTTRRPISSARALGGGPWKQARVSWYGPGFYGNTMAGGGRLTRTSMVVAHKTMRFGTRILFSYRGKMVVAVVKDRGPYVSGRTFDLGPGTAKALGFSGVGTVKYRIL